MRLRPTSQTPNWGAGAACHRSPLIRVTACPLVGAQPSPYTVRYRPAFALNHACRIQMDSTFAVRPRLDGLTLDGTIVADLL
jgi:hypothetical protein